MTKPVSNAGIIPEWEIKHRLQRAREIGGFTQTELAKVVGVSRATLANAEQGVRTPKRPLISAIAFATGVDPRWLETGKTPGGNDPDGGGQWWAIRDSNPGPTGSRLSPLRRGTVIPLTRELEPAEPAIAS